jgi:hypothetical protein
MVAPPLYEQSAAAGAATTSPKTAGAVTTAGTRKYRVSFIIYPYERLVALLRTIHRLFVSSRIPHMRSGQHSLDGSKFTSAA